MCERHDRIEAEEVRREGPSRWTLLLRWICEATHVPMIWATQVLETLAREGMPARAEITDAAMGHRDECVMLNNGPHVLSAVRVLDDILRRMLAHQAKKVAMLRALRLAHTLPAEPGAAPDGGGK